MSRRVVGPKIHERADGGEMVLPEVCAHHDLGALIQELRIRGGQTRHSLFTAGLVGNYIYNLEMRGAHETMTLKVLLRLAEACDHELVLRPKTKAERATAETLRG